MRLIDIDKRSKEWEKLCEAHFPNLPCQTLHDFLLSAPTVDVVECKDCVQWRRNIGFVDSPNGHCFYHYIDTNGHDYCSYGERRVEDA